MSNATFEVSEKGRQRVLSSGKKNVHAKICGELTYEPATKFDKTVVYNPYVFKEFMCKDYRKINDPYERLQSIDNAEFVECIAINGKPFIRTYLK